MPDLIKSVWTLSFLFLRLSLTLGSSKSMIDEQVISLSKFICWEDIKSRMGLVDGRVGEVGKEGLGSIEMFVFVGLLG